MDNIKNTLGSADLGDNDTIIVQRKSVESTTFLSKLKTYCITALSDTVTTLSTTVSTLATLVAKLSGTSPQTVAVSGATKTVDMSAGNFIIMTLAASTTLTLSTPSTGTYIFKIIQGGTGSYTVTWPSTVKWAGGTPPTLQTTVAKWDYIVLIWDGTYYSATSTLNFTV